MPTSDLQLKHIRTTIAEIGNYKACEGLNVGNLASERSLQGAVGFDV